ncbi:MAG TPA: DUF4405 domain-containing protein [Bacteroidales bacterium]|nr:DUF4405 domain-containing protein [Bacteroidales bacterium]HRZ75947.1 DUF4405 domain-containing protein [Bacteroidales bacterium]
MVDLIALVPFLFLLITGVIMLIYHSGTPREETTLFLNGEQWLWLHHLFTLIALPLVLLHLYLHWKVLLRNFMPGRKASNKPLNISLFLLLLSTASTGILSWLILSNTGAANLARQVHNKFGMALIVFYAIHLALHYSWLIRMSRSLDH